MKIVAVIGHDKEHADIITGCMRTAMKSEGLQRPWSYCLKTPQEFTLSELDAEGGVILIAVSVVGFERDLLDILPRKSARESHKVFVVTSTGRLRYVLSKGADFCVEQSSRKFPATSVVDALECLMMQAEIASDK